MEQHSLKGENHVRVLSLGFTQPSSILSPTIKCGHLSTTTHRRISFGYTDTAAAGAAYDFLAQSRKNKKDWLIEMINVYLRVDHRKTGRPFFEFEREYTISERPLPRKLVIQQETVHGLRNKEALAYLTVHPQIADQIHAADLDRPEDKLVLRELTKTYALLTLDQKAGKDQEGRDIVLQFHLKLLGPLPGVKPKPIEIKGYCSLQTENNATIETRPVWVKCWYAKNAVLSAKNSMEDSLIENGKRYRNIQANPTVASNSVMLSKQIAESLKISELRASRAGPNTIH